MLARRGKELEAYKFNSYSLIVQQVCAWIPRQTAQPSSNGPGVRGSPLPSLWTAPAQRVGRVSLRTFENDTKAAFANLATCFHTTQTVSHK